MKQGIRIWKVMLGMLFMAAVLTVTGKPVTVQAGWPPTMTVETDETKAVTNTCVVPVTWSTSSTGAKKSYTITYTPGVNFGVTNTSTIVDFSTPIGNTISGSVTADKVGYNAVSMAVAYLDSKQNDWGVRTVLTFEYVVLPDGPDPAYMSGNHKKGKPEIASAPTVFSARTAPSAKPAIKSIKITNAKQKYYKKQWHTGYWDASGNYQRGYYTGGFYETTYKVKVTLKKAIKGSRGLCCNNVVYAKGKGKTFTFKMTSTGKWIGKKIKIRFYAYSAKDIKGPSSAVKSVTVK